MTENEYRRLVRIAQSEDALNQAWIELRLSNPDLVNNPRVLIGRARRRVLDETRRRNRFRPSESAEFMSLRPLDSPAHAAEVVEAGGMVRQAIAGLHPLYREVMQLRWLHELSPNEIAQRNGIPVQTIYTRLRRAEAEIRDILSAFASPTHTGAE